MSGESSKFWLSLGSMVISRRRPLNKSQFRKLFKLSVGTINRLWRTIRNHTNLGASSFLWTLYFLKTNNESIEEVAEYFQTNKKTLLKLIREILWIIADVLPEFRFESRFENWPYLEPSCLVDTTFCRITRPYLSPWEYFNSHKNCHALLYQVVVSLGKPFRILSLDGPFKGAASDVGILRVTLLSKLRNGERLMADKGYEKEQRCWVPPLGKIRTLSPEQRQARTLVGRIRQLNERAIARLKTWGFMNRKWRGSYDFHGLCVKVIGKLTQLELHLYPLT